jgi:hypothetical protein
MRVLLGDIEFGEFMVGDEVTPMALVHRPYRMLTLDDDIAQDMAENLVAQGKYSAYVIPDLFDGEVAVSWRKEEGENNGNY